MGRNRVCCRFEALLCLALRTQPTKIPFLLVTDHVSGRQIGWAVTKSRNLASICVVKRDQLMGSHGLVFPMIGSSGLVLPVMMVLTGVVDFASEDEEGDVVAVGLFVVVGVDDDVAGEDVLDGEAAEFLAAVDVVVSVPFSHSD